MDTASFSRAILIKLIREQVLEVAQDRKKKPVFIIEEASLLRFQVLAELHTTTQFQGDSKPILSSILAGWNNLADLLIYRIPCSWPPGWWPGVIWPASPSRTCRLTSCTTSKS
ncbi:hypothetical protein DFAR_620004 [Desulfarculales bacterium]